MNFDAFLHALNPYFRFGSYFIAITMLIGLPLAIFITLALVGLFRRRVGRAMRATTAGNAETTTERAARPSPPALPHGELEIEQMQADSSLERADSRTALLTDARSHGNWVATIYAGAACSFSFIQAAITMAFGNRGYLANGFLPSCMLYGAYVLMHASPAVLAPIIVLKKQPRYLLFTLLILALLYSTFDISLQSDLFFRMARILALVPIAAFIALVLLPYRPNALVITVFFIVAVLWLPIVAQPIHYAAGGLTRLWLFFVPVPTAIVLLLNIRRLRAVGPIMYAAIAIFFLAYVYSTALLASAEIALGGEFKFAREDLNQIPIDQAFYRLFNEKAQEILSLPTPEQIQAWIDVLNPRSIIDPDVLAKEQKEMPLTFFLLVTKLVFGLVLAWLFIRWLANSYENRSASDQMLTIDVMMVIFVLLNFVLFSLLILDNDLSGGVSSGAISSGNDWILLGICVLAFPAYKLCSRWGLAWLRRSTPAAQPRTLLLLRVFGFDSRTQRLLEDVGQRWRHLGPIRLIGGTDLANAIIEPHEFFEFLNGRLSRAFVKGPSDVKQKLSRSAITADPDGTYRVEDFFCHDDTWRMTVVRLAEDADAILMDLRGFGPANQGCIYEIEQLLSSVPLDRVILLVDGRTNVPFLERVLQDAWRRMSDGSPNARAGHSRIRILQASSRHSRTLDSLLGLLCGRFVEEVPSRLAAPILHQPQAGA